MTMRGSKFFSVLLVNCAFLGPLAAAGTAFAGDTYTPPSSPELYEKEPVEEPAPKVRSKLYAGFNLGIGQSQTTAHPDTGPKSAWVLGPKLGYNKVLSTWSLFDADLSLIAGDIGHSDADIRINYGAMIRVGYGYSLGNRLFGIWKVGVGMFNANYTITDIDFKANNLMGTVVQGAFELLFPISSGVALTGAAQWNRFILPVDTVKGTIHGQDISLKLKDTERLNVWLVDVGIRFYF